MSELKRLKRAYTERMENNLIPESNLNRKRRGYMYSLGCKSKQGGVEWAHSHRRAFRELQELKQHEEGISAGKGPVSGVRPK